MIDANNLNPDRSNARIDYEGSDEDIESYPIDNEGSGRSKLPKICLSIMLTNIIDSAKMA